MLSKEKFIVILILLPIILYMWNFYGKPLSHETIDWGAFGSYFGGITSLVSIYLLYVTYCEQRRSNSITLYEQRFYIQIENVKNVQEQYNQIIERVYKMLLCHFHGKIVGEIPKPDAAMAVRYYYKEIRNSEEKFADPQKDFSYEKGFRYFCHAFFLQKIHQIGLF